MTPIESSPFRSTDLRTPDLTTLARHINPLELGTTDDPPESAQPDAARSFSHLVGRLMQRNETPAQREQTVYRNVEELVAQTLVLPVLEKLREDPLDSGLFKKTHGEKALRPLLEAEVAKGIVHHMRSGLVDVVARRLLNRDGPASHASGQHLDVTERRTHHA